MVKYTFDSGAYLAATGDFWNPIAYLNPTFAMRFQGEGPLPPWLLIFFVLWALPFLWIGVAMSTRRARDAGLSPWLGLSFLIPGLNYLAILFLATFKGGPARAPRPAPDEFTNRFAMFGIGVVILLCTGMIGLLTQGIEYYGVGLFFGIPFLLGAVTAYLFNIARQPSLASTLTMVTTVLIIGFLALLLFALEGMVCLVMVLPIMLGAALPGAIFGRSLAQMSLGVDATLGIVVLMFPLGALVERQVTEPALREVVTSIEIDAPPSAVWKNVVSFSELPPPSDWLFSTGIAYPLRARIDGEGVGAVRYCEFSTGAFVEPITVWDEPRRLSFDVTDQPVPMEEWSFYANVNPPHLDHSFKSLRGEFRLIETPEGGTLLEGSTWYALEMSPAPYWQVWGDAILHRIHRRVLEHIKKLSEEGPSSRD